MTVDRPIQDARNSFTHNTFEQELPIVYALLEHNAGQAKDICFCATCETLRKQLLPSYIPFANSSTRWCVICGAAFTPSRNHAQGQRTCSPKCSQAHCVNSKKNYWDKRRPQATRTTVVRR